MAIKDEKAAAAAPAAVVKDDTMLVTAKLKGFYGGVTIERGQTFRIDSRRHFSHRWMTDAGAGSRDEIAEKRRQVKTDQENIRRAIAPAAPGSAKRAVMDVDARVSKDDSVI